MSIIIYIFKFSNIILAQAVMWAISRLIVLQIYLCSPVEIRDIHKIIEVNDFVSIEHNFIYKLLNNIIICQHTLMKSNLRLQKYIYFENNSGGFRCVSNF